MTLRPLAYGVLSSVPSSDVNFQKIFSILSKGVLTHGYLIAGWPALMTLDTAAQYLSLDRSGFRRVARNYALHAVAPEDDEYRWRKADLDRLVKKLPDDLELEVRAASPKMVRLDDAAIKRIAEQVADIPKADITAQSRL